MRSRYTTHVLAGLGAFAFLVWHLVWGPHLYDAGELVAAASVLGGSHPPGQPLHALLAQLLSRIPLGSLAYRISLLSLISELGAAWLVGLITRDLAYAWNPKPYRLKELTPFIAALAAFLSPPMFRQTLRPEVYGLALGLCLFSMREFLQLALATSEPMRALRKAFLGAGLCAAVHPPHAMACVLFGAITLVLIRPKGWLTFRSVVLGVTIISVGLSAYALLPLRANAGAPMWGTPTIWSGFWDYIRGAAYRKNLLRESSSLFRITLDVGQYLLLQTAFVLPLALAWMGQRIIQEREHRKSLLVMALGVCAAAVAACLQPLEVRNPDNLAYVAPALCLLLALTTSSLISAEDSRIRAMFAMGAFALILANPFADRELETTLHTHSNALESLSNHFVNMPPARSLAIVDTDFVAASWMMAQQTEGARPDVAVLVSGLATSSWHWKSLRHHPLFRTIPPPADGPTRYAAYVNGARRAALARVSILSEVTDQVAAAGTLAGAYLWVLPHNAGLAYTRQERELLWSSEEHLHHTEELWQNEYMPHAEANSIFRHLEISRARLKIARASLESALQSYQMAAYPLPARQRALFAISAPQKKHPQAPLVRDYSVFLASQEDAVREAAIQLWSWGAVDQAQRLLYQQLERGDARSLLQLAWLYAVRGDKTRAKAAHQAFLTKAPTLHEEARPLTNYLQNPPR